MTVEEKQQCDYTDSRLYKLETILMKLSSTRKLEDLKVVLKDPSSTGPDPAYWVFSDVTEGHPELDSGSKNWANITVWAPGKLGEEYNKTFGHYHPENAVDETYHVIEGKGILQLQKRHIENGVWIKEKVDEVFLIKAEAGDEIIITWEYGHCWSNVGDEPLITYDNWRSGHSPSDYEPIEKLHGLAYYLLEENGEVKATPNPNYRNLPKPEWLTPEEYTLKLNL